MSSDTSNVSVHRGSSEFVLESRTAATVAERAPFKISNMRAIIFDLDRHLVDTDSAFDIWWKTGVTVLVQALGKDKQEVESWLRKAEAEFKTIFFFHRLDLVPAVVESASSLNLDIAVLSQITFEAANKLYHEALQLAPEILEMLIAARKFATASQVKLALVTGGSRNHTLDKLNAIGIGSYFDLIVCGGKHAFEDDSERGLIVPSALEDRVQTTPTGVTKRNLSCFQWVLSVLEEPAKYTMTSGDHPIEDVQNIQILGGYGLQSFWYNNSPREDVTPDLSLTKPQILTSLFRAAV